MARHRIDAGRAQCSESTTAELLQELIRVAFDHSEQEVLAPHVLDTAHGSYGAITVAS